MFVRPVGQRFLGGQRIPDAAQRLQEPGALGAEGAEYPLRFRRQLAVYLLERRLPRRRQFEPHVAAIALVAALHDQSLGHQRGDPLADQRLAHVQNVADLAVGRARHFAHRHRDQELGVADALGVEHALSRQPVETRDDLVQQEGFGLGEPGFFHHAARRSLNRARSGSGARRRAPESSGSRRP